MLAIGIDIGGTKCAACLGRIDAGGVDLLARRPERVTRDYTPRQMLEALVQDIGALLRSGEERAAGIGISCGGPLDSRAGVILSPPNLPGWDEIHITEELTRRTGLPAWLCNDANAGALAEWKFGAGQGASDMLFLTFGTGMGAGLILNGRLYPGACDMAGELGHIRLAEYGPVGYRKMGSFEGFCSGGGVAQLARSLVLEELQAGNRPALCPDIEALPALTAKAVGDYAKKDDPLACKIMHTVGEQLGRGLSIVIDLLNPERIIIGGVFARCHDEIWPAAEETIRRETLAMSRKACQVLPSRLSESVGDIAALSVAYYYSQA